MRNAPGKSSPGELLRLFLRLGLTAFGGPAAHIVLMEREAVERRRWMSRERFLDLVGACNLLPGPSSTQVAMALGFDRGNWPGLVTAGCCFILPATLATLALAVAYARYGGLPQTQGLLYGAKPVMVAIVVQAIWNLGRTAFRRWMLALAGLACFTAAVAGAPPIAVLLACGGLMLALEWQRTRRTTAVSAIWAPASLGGVIGAAGVAPIFLAFFKLGIAVFGSGYVLLAFLRTDLVDRLHWITQAQLLDAVTAGQLTPGPVFATATFIGYLVHGWTGAAAATIGIFLPSFFMAGAVGAFASRIRSSRLAAAFLDGVNAAAVALMAAVALALGRAAFTDLWSGLLGLASVALLVRFKVNATWLIAGGGALGILLRSLHS